MNTKFDTSGPPPEPKTEEEAVELICELQSELVRARRQLAALQLEQQLLETSAAARGSPAYLTPKARRKLEKRLKRLQREVAADEAASQS